MDKEYWRWRRNYKEYERAMIDYNGKKELIDMICKDLEGVLPNCRVATAQDMSTKFLVKPTCPAKPKKTEPKRPKSGYILFMQDFCTEFKETNPESGLCEISKAGKAKWDKLSKFEKDPYLDLAYQAQKEYKQQNLKTHQ